MGEALAMKRKSQMSDEERVRDFQRKIYRKTKQEESFRFYALYDKIGLPYVLREAYKRCRRNGGSPGVDGVTFQIIDENGVGQFLSEISNELKLESYKPDMVRRVTIPKANGKMRPLGIPTIKDRVIQAACKIVVEPIFDADFQANSYGFRPKKSASMAIGAIRLNLKEGRNQVYDADLSSYFDTIPHDKLMKVIALRISDKKVLHLIKMWLKVPVKDRDGNISGGRKNKEGTPQGGVISPLLANVYLNILDRAVNRVNGIYKKKGIRIVRYADDFILMGRSMPDSIINYTEELLKKLGLEINGEKTRRVNAIENSFDFLGFTFRYENDKFGRPFKYWNVFPSKKSEQRLINNLKEYLNTHKTRGSKYLCGDLNIRIGGWFRYFSIKGISYPRKSADKVEEYLKYKLHKVFKKKSQRKSKLCSQGVYKALIMKYGLVEVTNWSKLATVNV